MPTYRDEFDVLLPAVNPIEGELVREVLEQAGIPSMLQRLPGPDFDDFGLLTPDMLRGADVLVPKGARSAAREALVSAWGEGKVAAVERGL